MIRILCLALIALLIVPASATAQGYQSFGDYRVHYGAFPSGFLQPELARDYGVVRSRKRGVLTLTLLEQGQPALARTRALATTEDGDVQRIELREVRAGEATSYVGGFEIEDGETLRFEIEIFPRESDRALTLQFSQQFFTD